MSAKKFFLIAMFPALLFAQGNIYKFEKKSNYSAVYSGYNMLIAATPKGNYSISSFQYKHKVHMYFAGLSVYEKGVKDPCNESKTPEGKCTELAAEANDGRILWKVKYQWRNMDVVRTIETGDFPGFKLTYDIEVTKDFQPDRVYLSFRLPQDNLYTRTGYFKNGVIQFRPVQKAEWFGIQRSKEFPCISFSGDTVNQAVIIMAGDMKSWNMLPKTLLYSTTKKCYWTVEFMYNLGKELKKGDKFTLSAYIIPSQSESVAADMQENFLKLKDRLQ